MKRLPSGRNSARKTLPLSYGMIMRHELPEADTDEMPRRSLNRMTSDAFHDPAFGSPTGHRRRTSPVGPMTCRYPAAKNPTERPSRDQKGISAPVVPAI